MVYTKLNAVEHGLHGIFESSNLKSTDIGNLYDALIRDAEDNAIDCDNGVAIKIGEYTGDGLQERYATIAKVGDKIAVTGAPAIVKDAFTKLQAEPFNFYNKAGFDTKSYEVVAEDIFAVAEYQFTNDALTAPVKVGDYVVVDGNGMWTAQTAEPAGTYGFVGKVHSIAVGDFYKIVRIFCVKNEQK